MSLIEEIKKDIVKSMKNKDTTTVTLLRTLVGEINRNPDKNLSDIFVIKEIRNMVSNIKLVLEMEGKNPESVEIEILDRYLPTFLNEEETKIIVLNIIKENGFSTMKNIGGVMGKISSHEKTNIIDKKLASTIAKYALS